MSRYSALILPWLHGPFGDDKTMQLLARWYLINAPEKIRAAVNATAPEASGG